MPCPPVRFVAFAACAVLVVAGCSGSNGDVADPSGTASPSLTATATPTVDIPDVPVPTRPADEHTSEGAIAFVEYAVEVINRAYLTGDTDALVAIATTDCPSCLRAKKDIDSVYARGNAYRGGQVTLVETGEAVIAEDVIPTVPSRIDIGVLEEVNVDGAVVESFPALDDSVMLWDLKWRDGNWLLAGVRV